jgi:DNA-binding beta-propeller fold protein YncE
MSWLVAVVAVAFPASAQTELPRRPLAEVITAQVMLPGPFPGQLHAPQHLAVTPNAVWIVHHRAGRVDRVDPTTNEVVTTVDLGLPSGRGPGLEGIAADARNVWVFNDDRALLVHIDARTNRVVGSVPTTGDPISGVPVVDGDSVWAKVSNAGDIVRISSRTNKVTKVVHVRDAPAWPLAIVDGALWAGSYDRSAPADQAAQLHRIDLKRGKVIKTVTGISGSGGTAVGEDLWIGGCDYLGRQQAATGCPSVRRIDGRTGAVKADVAIDGTYFSASNADHDALAVLVIQDIRPNTPMWVTVIDTRRNAAVAAYDVAASEYPGNLAYGHGSLWLTDWTANAVSRIQLTQP